MATINSTAISGLREQIDAAVQEADGVPGVQYFAVNKNGEYIFEHSSGKVGLGKQEDMTEKNAMWIASCTKVISGIACMQLVEQGKLALDDVAQVEELAPELKDVKVLQEDGTLVEKQKGITLRMLLCHTAGFSYSFYSSALRDHWGPLGIDELSGEAEDYLNQPLCQQPGQSYAYGSNVDWVGVLIMRVTGLSLADYFQKNITGPLGIENDVSFFPDDQMRKDLAWFHEREPTGKVQVRLNGHLFRAPLMARTEERRARIFNSAGAGCFARPKAFCQIIAVLLNDGLHAPSGHRLLKKETVDAMFTNQFPDLPDFGRRATTVSKPDYSNPSPELYPEPGNPPQGWGLTFFLHLSDSMVHSKGTAWWAGLPNLFWWCDRTKGIGGICGTQLVPFGDLKTITLWMTIEGGLYANLVQPT